MKNKLIRLLIFIFSGISFPGLCQTRLAGTEAGNSIPLDGPNLSSQFLCPWQIVVRDSLAYIADQGYIFTSPFPGIDNYASIRELNIRRKTVRTIATGQVSVSGLALSNRGDSLFFTTNGNILKMYRRSTGLVTILDTLQDAELDAVVCDRKGRLLLGGGTGHRILLRELNGTYKTLAGKFGVSGMVDGLDTLARFNKISGLALSQSEDTVYISDRFNSRVRRLVRSTKQVSSLITTNLFGPRQITLNRRRDTLLVANSSGHTVFRFAIRSNSGQLFAGAFLTPGYADGSATNSRFQFPMGIARSDSGWLVCDNENRRIRRVSFGGNVSTFAGIGYLGDGIGESSRLFAPYDLVKLPGKDTVIFTDQNNHAIRMLDLVSKRIRTLAGNGIAGNVFGIGQAARLSRPTNLAVSVTGDSIYFTEPFSNKIKLLLFKTGEVKWVAGSDTSGMVDKPQGRFSRFNRPQDLALRGNLLYVTDVQNHRIRVVNTQTTAVTTFAGSTNGFKDTTLLQSRFNRPFSLEWVGSQLFIGEDGGLRIRRLSPDSGFVKVWAGSGNLGNIDGLGTSARFRGISKLSYDTLSKLLFVGGFQNEGILRAVDTRTPMVSTYLDSAGYRNGYHPFTKFTGPSSIVPDVKRKRYLLTDVNNNRIRTLQLFVNTPPTAVVDSVFEILEDRPGPYPDFASEVRTGSGAGDTLQKVQFFVRSNPAVMNVNLATNGSITINLKPDTNGDIHPVRLVLKDNGKTFFGGVDSTVYSLKLRVIPVNDPPQFTIFGNDTAYAGQPKGTPQFIKTSKPGPPDESAQTISYAIGLSRPFCFTQSPFIRNDTLFYTSHPDSLGLVQASIVATDNGGIANGGQSSSEPKFFSIFLYDIVSNQFFQNKPLSIRFFPNPAKKILHYAHLPFDAEKLILTDISGRTVKEYSIENTGSGTLNIADCKAGVYFIRANSPFLKPMRLIVE